MTQLEAHDPVTRPAHYITPSGMEAIDIIECYGLSDSFHCANAFKYLVRAGKKGEANQDIAKAQWYLLRYRDYVEEYQPEFPVAYGTDDAELFPEPETVVEAFGLSGTVIGEAVLHLLKMCLEEDEMESLEAAIACLEEAIVPTEAA